MNCPEELKYSDQHEWVKVEGTVAVVGITDYAQEALGDLTFVELPFDGDDCTKDEEACSIESAKAASGIYAPVSGTIAEVNSELEDSPELVNSDPYGQGWLFKIEMSDPSQLDGLMDVAAYKAFLAEQE